MTTVDAYGHCGDFDFKTREEAKKYVADLYRRQWGPNAIVLFHIVMPLGLMLEVEDRIFIIREDES